ADGVDEREDAENDGEQGLFVGHECSILYPRHVDGVADDMDDAFDMHFANPDFDREARWGLPEVVLGIGKTDGQIVDIVGRLRERNAGPVLVTKTTRSAFDAVRNVAPEAEFFEDAKLIRLARPPVVSAGVVGVLAAGTADLPIAEEAALTADAAGASVDRIYDVGVAGLHRLVDRLDR